MYVFVMCSYDNVRFVNVAEMDVTERYPLRSVMFLAR